MSRSSSGADEREAGTPAIRGVIDRREAIRRVSALLGGITLVGGSGLIAACEKARPPAYVPIGEFTVADIAFLDEVAETILPETKTPGAKAAQTGPFMALMVTDTYTPSDQKLFRDGMLKIDEAIQKAAGARFIAATPQQRLSLLESLDREQKSYMDAREAARKAKRNQPDTVKVPKGREPEALLPSQREEASPGPDAAAATAITADAPAHYFRMMKELTLLGYFTSEIGCNQALRYVESPGRFDPCVTYNPGERSWASHA
jgi:hypothetical protein